MSGAVQAVHEGRVNQRKLIFSRINQIFKFRKLIDNLLLGI